MCLKNENLVRKNLKVTKWQWMVLYNDAISNAFTRSGEFLSHDVSDFML